MSHKKNYRRILQRQKAGSPVRFSMHYASPYPSCGMNFGAGNCGCGHGPHGPHGPKCGCGGPSAGPSAGPVAPQIEPARGVRFSG